MDTKCPMRQFFQRNRLVLLHFIFIFIALFSHTVSADQSANSHANRIAEIKADLLKMIQKGNGIAPSFYSYYKKKKKKQFTTIGNKNRNSFHHKKITTN